MNSLTLKRKTFEVLDWKLANVKLGIYIAVGEQFELRYGSNKLAGLKHCLFIIPRKQLCGLHRGKMRAVGLRRPGMGTTANSITCTSMSPPNIRLTFSNPVFIV